MSGRKLAAALAAIAVLAFVLPPLAANQVHARRIDRCKQAVARLAAALEPFAGQYDRHAYVYFGRGAAPAVTPDLNWPDSAALPLAGLIQRLGPSGSNAAAGAGVTMDDEPDPWGNHYLVVISGSGPKGAVTVLSAGPNGMLETPFGSASTPRGDDIVAVR